MCIDCGVQVDMQVLSPRAVCSEHLFGKYDAISGDWKDGVLPCLFRAHATDTSASRKWLVLDGPIGPLSLSLLHCTFDSITLHFTLLSTV